MATVALAVVGNVIAPGVGGALGAALGGWIDNSFIFPAIFGADVPSQEGPRLDRMQLQSASEGSPQLRIYGPRARVSGTIIWVSDIREVKTTEEVGGGKGGGGKPAGVTVTYQYFCDVAVAVCRGPISKIAKIKGDERTIYQAARNYEVVSALISMENLAYLEGPPKCTVSGPGIGQLSVSYRAFGPFPVTVSGFSNAANNGAWIVESVNVGANSAVLSKPVGAALFVDETGAATLQQYLNPEETANLSGTYTVDAVEPRYVGRIRAPANVPSLAEFLRDEEVTVSGFASPANNGTFVVESAREEDDGSTTLEVRKNDTTAFVTAAASPAVTVEQSQPEVVSRCDNVTIYPGDETQVADPTIASHESNVPAFRGTAYFVLENLSLTDFGNRVPNFNAFVEADEGGDPPFASYTVGDAIEAILDRAGFLPGGAAARDASAADEEMLGYVVPGPQSLVQQLEPLMLAFDLTTYELDGEVTFLPQDETDVGSAADDDLGAAQAGATAQVRDLEVVRPSGMTLPREVTIEFADPDLNLQAGAVRERRADGPADNAENLKLLQLTLDASRARGIAQRTLWRAWSEQQRATMSLPPSFAWLKEGDRLVVGFKGETYVVRVTQATLGANGVVEVEGLVQLDVDVDQEVGVGARTGFADQGYRAPQITLHVLNLPPLVSGHVDAPGYYFAVAATDPAAEYLGGTLFDSVDGASYDQVANFPPETAMGRATTVLQDAPTTTQVDEESTVTVELTEGALSSITQDQLLEGNKNVALVGEEILAFRDATLVASRTYQLSGLIRGVRNTEDHAVDHVVGDAFVLLAGTVGFVQVSTGAIGSSRLFKPVGVGGSLNDATAQPSAILGETLRPFSPTAVQSSRDGSGDIRIDWQRRSRDVAKPFAAPPPALLDAPERYEVDVKDGAGDVVRTIEVNGVGDGTAFAVYTAAQQTTDGFTPGDPRDVAIYQISPTLGRGNAAEFTA